MKKALFRNSCTWALVCFLASLSLVDKAHAAATITVVNNDGPGEGLNDTGAPDAASTAGGNSGTTLGQQRLFAYQFAANIWEGRLDSSVEIRVNAQFNPLTCSATSGVLGSAGPTTVHRDFAGAPAPSTWYVQALANALNGSDLDPTENDVNSQFQSNLGTAGCLPSLRWYYGLDGNPPPDSLDFVTVVLHRARPRLGIPIDRSPRDGCQVFGLRRRLYASFGKPLNG